MTQSRLSLKQRRERSGYTLAAVARGVGLSESSVSRLERGVHTFSIQSAQAFATFYKCSLDDIVQAPTDAAE